LSERVSKLVQVLRHLTEGPQDYRIVETLSARLAP
jgi:hypothetical protein